MVFPGVHHKRLGLLEVLPPIHRLNVDSLDPALFFSLSPYPHCCCASPWLLSQGLVSEIPGCGRRPWLGPQGKAEPKSDVRFSNGTDQPKTATSFRGIWTLRRRSLGLPLLRAAADHPEEERR